MSTTTKTVTRIAAIGNKYGNVRIGANSNDIKCIIVDSLAPIVGEEDKFATGFVPVSVVAALINNDFRASLLIASVAKKLESVAVKSLSKDDALDPVIRKGIRESAKEQATRKVFGALKIKATYALRVAGEVYTKADGSEGAYTTDWYELLTDTIRLSFGDKRDAYLACNADAFIEDNSAIEDF